MPRLNLYRLGALLAGDKVLLHAGASGVGSAAIQLCKAFGNPCWVSVGSAERGLLRVARRAGRRVARRIAGGAARFRTLRHDPRPGRRQVRGAQPAAAGHGRALGDDRPDGRTQGRAGLAGLLAKRIQLIGSTLRSRDADYKADLLAEMEEKVWPLFTSGKLSPRLERTFAIGDVGAAFAALASNTVSGKVALVIDDSLA